MALRDLINNDPGFNYYYGGQGNFTQRSLPWGDSKSPYVKWPINGERVSLSGDKLQDLITLNKNTLDFPIRGGANSSERSPYGTMIPGAAQIDYHRISRFLKDGSKGKIFIDKQVGLQASNPLIEAGTQVNISNDITSDRFLGEIQNTRIYNKATNLLTQVSLGGSGTHVERHGVVPFNAPSTLYSYIVPRKSTEENRLVVLYRSKVPQTPLTTQGVTQLSRLGISSTRGLLFDYLGGPKSFLGIGSTTIRRYVDTDLSRQAIGDRIGETNPNQVAYTFNYAQIANAKDKIENAQGNGPYDFRDELIGYIPKVGYGYYKENNLEAKRGFGNPGKKKVDKFGNENKLYTVSDPDRIDKLNALKLFYINSDVDPWGLPNDNTKDIIRFGFEAIDNDDINKSIIILFRAFLDSFNDNHSADMSSFRYVGRGDEFNNYLGFKRDITFSFKIAAQSRDEMKPLYQKLNALVSQIYPDYSVDDIMRAPIVKLTVGDYIVRQPGRLTSMNIVIEKEFPWEINMRPDIEKDIAQLPQILSIQCTFKPIHNFLPQRVKRSNPDNSGIIGTKFGTELIVQEDAIGTIDLNKEPEFSAVYNNRIQTV